MQPGRMQTLLHTGEYGAFEGAIEDQVVFGHYRSHNCWSSEILNLIQKFLGGTGGTFIDVGANIGLVAIPIAERCGARVFAFEPEPGNFHLLSRNVARHRLGSRVTLFANAAYSQRAILPMHLSANNFGDHQVLTSDASGQVLVAAEPLDDLLRDHIISGPVAMKIDTQGCEVHVLRGAQETLRCVDTLILEYWPLGIARLGDKLTDFIPLLSEFPYGQILSQTGKVQSHLGSTPRLLEGLARLLATDDPGFFDLCLRRHPE